MLAAPAAFTRRHLRLQRAQLARLRRAPARGAHAALQADPHRRLYRAPALHRRRHRGEPFVSRPPCPGARPGGSPRRSAGCSRRRARGSSCTICAADPWELRNVADDPAYAKRCASSRPCCEEWIERTDDFPAAYRVRDDNTDRITGVQFTTRIPPLRNPEPPPRRSGGARRGRHDPRATSAARGGRHREPPNGRRLTQHFSSAGATNAKAEPTPCGLQKRTPKPGSRQALSRRQERRHRRASLHRPDSRVR